MNLYRIRTRQTTPTDLQHYVRYVVSANNEEDARAFFQRRLKHAVITGVTSVDDTNLLLLECR